MMTEEALVLDILDMLRLRLRLSFISITYSFDLYKLSLRGRKLGSKESTFLPSLVRHVDSTIQPFSNVKVSVSSIIAFYCFCVYAGLEHGSRRRCISSTGQHWRLRTWFTSGGLEASRM